MSKSAQILRVGDRYNSHSLYQSEVAVIRGLSGPKMVEFCYDDNTRELEPDHGANYPYYEAQDIIVRKWKLWIITRVSIQHVLS